MDTQELKLTPRQLLMVDKIVEMNNTTAMLLPIRRKIMDRLVDIVVTDEFSDKYTVYGHVETIVLEINAIEKENAEFSRVVALMLLDEMIDQGIEFMDVEYRGRKSKQAMIASERLWTYDDKFYCYAEVGKTTVVITRGLVAITGLEDYLANRIVGE